MTPIDRLPEFLQKELQSCPKAGEGVHGWLFKMGRQLHAHMPGVEIVNLLESCVANCGRHVPRSEIVDAVRNSLPCAWQPRDNQAQGVPTTTPKCPDLNREYRETITHEKDGVVHLWENSPIRFEDNESHTEEIIDALFFADSLLCCGLSNSKFETRSRPEWRGQLSAQQLIVPNPRLARSGLTKKGTESAHALSITGLRRFLVIEFDEGDVDDHAALLWHLALKAPLALVVHSGSRSLHGWFFCAGQPAERLHQVMRYCVSLGACTSTWSRSQFVRMPGGLRDNGKRQTVYYFNPGVIK